MGDGGGDGGGGGRGNESRWLGGERVAVFMIMEEVVRCLVRVWCWRW